MPDRWKQVDGFDGRYYVSTSGQVYSKISDRLMTQQVNKCGYRYVHLRGGGVSKNVNVHRLVAKAFVDNADDKPCVNHIDGNKENNVVSNLEWCTHSENVNHAIDHDLLKVCGEYHHKHKLTSDDVLYIRQHYKSHSKEFGAIPLANRFGVDINTIINVVKGHTWNRAV